MTSNHHRKVELAEKFEEHLSSAKKILLAMLGEDQASFDRVVNC